MRDVAEVGRGEAEPALLGSAGRGRGNVPGRREGWGTEGGFFPAWGLGRTEPKTV